MQKKTFADCSLVVAKITMPPNFAEKSVANSHKASNGMGSRLVTQGVYGVSHWFIVVTGLRWDLACTLRKWGVVYHVTHVIL